MPMVSDISKYKHKSKFVNYNHAAMYDLLIVRKSTGPPLVLVG